jgi:type VI secretion system protein ImpF
MAGLAPRPLPLQSLLDRFIDPYEPMIAPDAAERRLREAVRRDVEWLLNSRRTPQEVPHAELRRSLYIWGLPDLAGFTARSKPDRLHLQRLLQETITALEPRLRDVRVLISQAAELTYTIRFTIEATLVAPPCIERVAFNTVVELGTGNCRVEGTR